MTNEIPDIITFLVEKFQEQGMTEPGAPPTPSGLDDLDAGLLPEEKEAAHKAIEDFAGWCVKFLQEHPPQTQVMLAQGFGVRLAGGFDVALTVADENIAKGAMENSTAYSITAGSTIRGQNGVYFEPSVPIMGTESAPALRVRR